MGIAELRSMQGWELDVLLSVQREADTGERDIDFDADDPGEVAEAWQ